MSDIKVFYRIGIIGSHRVRVDKVLSLLANQPTLVDYDDEPDKRQIHVEYVPCVATFGSYEGEDGNPVKYLMKIENNGASLAQFFDEVVDEKNEKNVRIPGIAAFVMGCGIEPEDVSLISSFINLITGKAEATDDEKVVVKCAEPNDGYSSMKEETIAYKNLSPSEKEEVTKAQIIGPGKMVKLAIDLAKECLPRSKKALAKEKQEQDAKKVQVVQQKEEKEPQPPPMPKEYNPNTKRFACKMCRTILCNEDDLEDPPHTVSQHTFSSRKTKSGANVNSNLGNRCQSIFLADGLDWMGDISLSHEGKIICPKCNGKLGIFKWHGTQCSCGTWVTPAIMIHKSRIDELPSETDRQNLDPLRHLTSPLAGLHVGVQRFE